MLTSNFIFGTDIQSSDEEEGVVRPKRVKSVPCISFRFQQFINIILICRCLTDDEKVMQGLTTGQDAPLEVREGGICGRGVFATGEINKGSWLCEYRTTCVFPQRKIPLSKQSTTPTGRGHISSTPVSPSHRRATFVLMRRVSTTSWDSISTMPNGQMQSFRDRSRSGASGG